MEVESSPHSSGHIDTLLDLELQTSLSVGVLETCAYIRRVIQRCVYLQDQLDLHIPRAITLRMNQCDMWNDRIHSPLFAERAVLNIERLETEIEALMAETTLLEEEHYWGSTVVSAVTDTSLKTHQIQVWDDDEDLCRARHKWLTDLASYLVQC